MLQFDVDPSGAAEYLIAIDGRIKDTILNRTNLLLEVLAERIQGNLSGGMLQERTGRLYRSVTVTPAEFDGTGITGGVSAAGGDASYGQVFESGAAEYEIRRAYAKVLAWMGEGKMRFAAYVEHPEIPITPWFSSEEEWARTNFGSQLNQAIKEVL